MGRHLCIALTVIACSPAQATEFRCYPPDPVGFYRATATGDDVYRIVRGRFSFDMQLLPYGGEASVIPVIRDIPARFTGHLLGRDGFVAALGFHLTIEPHCTMVSCPYLEQGTEVIAFVRQAADGPVLDADPCLTPVFAATRAVTDLLVHCLGTAACVAD